MAAWLAISLMPRGERNHDLGLHLHAFFRDLDGRFEDGARLHFGDLGIGDAETAAAQAEHRVDFVQLLNAIEQSVKLLQLGRAGLGDLRVSRSRP